MIEKQNKKDLYKPIFLSVITIALPTMLEQIMSVFMQYVDTAMVGRLGANATAAVSTSTSITWLVGSIPSAFGVAAMTLIAQALGCGEKKAIRRIAAVSLGFAVGVGMILEIICLAVSPFVAGWMGASAQVAPEARAYFFWISLPVVLKTVNIVLASAIRATKDTKTPMRIGIGANVLNVVLDYVFIYIFDLGVRGAAYATALSMSFSGIAMLIVFFRNDLLSFTREDLNGDREYLRKMWRLSLPVLIINMASCAGYVVFAGMVSHMGTVIFAAHSIALGAEELFYIGGYGFKSASNTLVGIAYGEGNHDKYHVVCVSAVVCTLIIMTISGILLFIFARPLMGFFTTDTQVIELGTTVLKMVAFNEPFFGIYVVTEGIYYGLGRTRYPLFVEFFGMWVIRILSTWICIHFFGLGLRAVWCCMIADNVTKAILLAWPLRKLWK